ncbi:DUF2062 domain-containing protein [Candidatus Dependentiae bacterium]|nr:DUF2062 domain-containing protein [Candidatus Dependentiae bacterium]
MIQKTVPKIKEVLRKALLDGITPESLARSAGIGVYVAFSPFPGGHTIMMLLAKWLLKLHFPTLFIFTSINNPWTMIPFFSLDYAFGYWLIHKVIGWEPAWTISLAKIFGSGSVCIWSFFIGGNILGIIGGIVTYPLMLFVFERMHTKILAGRGNS